MISFIFPLLSVYFAHRAYKRLQTIKNKNEIKLIHPFFDIGMLMLWFINGKDINDVEFHNFKKKSIIFMLIFPVFFIVEMVLKV